MGETQGAWFAPVSGDLKLGGRYQIEGDAGGTLIECVPRERFARTWEIFGAVSWVTVRVEPMAEGARLTVEHVVHIDAHWEKFGAGAGGIGWELGFLGLARFLAVPADAVRDEGMTWMTSPEALTFYRRVSEGWARASIDAGLPEDEANAAAERTPEEESLSEPPRRPQPTGSSGHGLLGACRRSLSPRPLRGAAGGRARRDLRTSAPRRSRV